MKSSLNRFFLVAGTALLGALLAAPTVFAGSPEGEGEKQSRRGDRAAVADREVDRMARVLQLNEDQKAEWRRLSEEQGAQTRPLFRQMRDITERLEEEASGEAPDPTVVGQLELDRRDVARKLGASRRAAEEDLVRLLDREQRIRWEAVRDNDRAGRRGRFDRGGRGPRSRN